MQNDNSAWLHYLIISPDAYFNHFWSITLQPLGIFHSYLESWYNLAALRSLYYRFGRKTPFICNFLLASASCITAGILLATNSGKR